MSDSEYPKPKARLRREIKAALFKGIAVGQTPDSLTETLVDLFETALHREPTKAALLGALETLQRKADGQVEYWCKKQLGMPALEDFMDEDGVYHFPADIWPLLEERQAHGRYCEADWWQGTIRELIGRVAGNEVAVPDDTGLRDFAATMLYAAFQGGDADGAYIQDTAVKHGLLREVPFDPEIHTDPDGYAEPGDGWHEFAGGLASDIRLRNATSAGKAIDLLARLGVSPAAIDTIDIGTWRLVPAEPSFEMKQAGSRHYHIPVAEQGMFPMAEQTWKEMLAIAPHPAAGPSKRTQVTASVTGVDYALSRLANELPGSEVLGKAVRKLASEGAWHIRFPTAAEYKRLGPIIIELLEEAKGEAAALEARRSAVMEEHGW
nr:hypothetical protein [Neorhizobium tomejilense]